MNNIKSIGTKLILATALVGSVAIFRPQTAHAGAFSTNYIKKFPKNIEGKWYAYTNFGLGGKRKLYKLNLSAKAYHFHAYKKHEVLYGNIPAKKKAYFNKTSKWSYADTFTMNGYKWVNFIGWQQSAGDCDSYNVHKFGKHTVLSAAGGATNSVSAHYYRSVKVAKHMADKHYPGFTYNN